MRGSRLKEGDSRLGERVPGKARGMRFPGREREREVGGGRRESERDRLSRVVPGGPWAWSWGQSRVLEGSFQRWAQSPALHGRARGFSQGPGSL